MYIKDLTEHKNHITIGWLDKSEPFSVLYEPKYDKKELLKKLKEAKVVSLYRGVHACQFCYKKTGNGEIKFKRKSDGKIYVSPILIIHYIEEHAYMPPECFVNDILNNNGEFISQNGKFNYGELNTSESVDLVGEFTNKLSLQVRDMIDEEVLNTVIKKALKSKNINVID